MTNWLSTFLIILCVIPTFLQAETDPIFSGTEVTLQQVLDYAFEHNPGWKAGNLRVLQAREKVKEASGWENLNLSISQFVDPLETRLGPQETILNFSQKIPFWGQTEYGENAANAMVDSSKSGLEQERLTLITDIKKTWYDLWELQQTREVLLENQQLLEQISSLGSVDNTGGGGTLRSVLKAQTQIGQSAYDLVLVEDRLASTNIRLNSLMGRTDMNFFPRIAKPETPEFDATLTAVLDLVQQHSPELKQLDANISKSRFEAEQMDAQTAFPGVTLGVNYFVIGEPLNPNMLDAGKDAWNIMLGISIPWGNSKLSSRASQAELEAQRTAMLKEHRSNMLRDQTSRVYYKIINAQRLNTLFQQTLLPHAQNTLSLADRAYRTGQETSMAVLEARNVLLNFQISAIRALADWLRALAELEQLTGKSLAS
ncbi:MAG: TolC family protein [SAR324 cluster bacterium]|nr:TolC family protein [SAR324 cluster bacterium]